MWTQARNKGTTEFLAILSSSSRCLWLAIFFSVSWQGESIRKGKRCLSAPITYLSYNSASQGCTVPRKKEKHHASSKASSCSGSKPSAAEVRNWSSFADPLQAAPWNLLLGQRRVRFHCSSKACWATGQPCRPHLRGRLWTTWREMRKRGSSESNMGDFTTKNKAQGIKMHCPRIWSKNNIYHLPRSDITFRQYLYFLRVFSGKILALSPGILALSPGILAFSPGRHFLRVICRNRRFSKVVFSSGFSLFSPGFSVFSPGCFCRNQILLYFYPKTDDSCHISTGKQHFQRCEARRNFDPLK